MSDEILKLIKDKEVQYVDLRFNDLRGKMQHVTFDVSMIDKDIFTEGTMFDGSSIAGWKAINESDMVMRPDPNGAHIDPFYQQTTLAMFCDILEPGTLQPYSRCPRSDREEGGSVCEVVGRRRRRVLRSGSRVLRVRRRALVNRSEQHRLLVQFNRTAVQHRQGL